MPTIVEQQTRLGLRNILFTTDFSALAENALPYASALARHYGAQIYVGHAISAEPFLAVPVDALPAEFNNPRHEAEHAMEKFLRTAPLKDVRVEPILRKGPHEFVFTNMVETLNIDLVVAATHGRSGLRKLLLGSVAEEIFRSVPSPVLTVGPDVITRDVIRDEVFEVLCAIDSSGSPHALAYAAALASDYGAHLCVIHVIADHQEMPLYYRDKSLETARLELERLVLADKSADTPEVVLRLGNVCDNILDLAADLKPSVIVMGAQQSSAPRMAAHLPLAFAHEIVRHAHCPVLTVPKAFEIELNS